MQRMVRDEVKILPGLFAERMKLNRNYIRELDTRCLLQNYYLEAGEIMEGIQVVEDPAAARLHWGWESPTCQLRGHFLGHWLSAASEIVVLENDAELKVKIDHIVSELHRLQKLNEEGGGTHGWVAPIPEKYFDILMTDRYIWSPQYTMHKLLMGLTHVLVRLKHQEAGEVLSGLADWYLQWTEKAQKRAAETGGSNAVYAGEQAGMLETWADLYAATKDERYRTLCERYADNSLFEILDQNGDPLTDNHTNASIPLAHGAARMYEVTGEKKWKKRTETFWKKAVTERGMYATTGNNSGEFWIPPMKEGQFLSPTDQEFCTVYNMVRLAAYLYDWTGEAAYADYIERAIYNGFLAQQSRANGMPTYFLPMLPGSRKKWASKTHDFWCCLGTMVQAQTLYPSLIYRADEERREILVGQYIPSEAGIRLEGTTVRLTQKSGMKNYSNQAFFDERGGGALSRWVIDLEAEAQGDPDWTLKLRVPSWCDGVPQLIADGEALPENTVKKQIEDGYLTIPSACRGKKLTVRFSSEPVYETLPDEPEKAAILSGPVVLAGLTEQAVTLRGKKAKKILKKRMTHTYSTFPWEQDHFETTGQAQNIRLIPLYEVEDEPYTIYFDIDDN